MIPALWIDEGDDEEAEDGLDGAPDWVRQTTFYRQNAPKSALRLNVVESDTDGTAATTGDCPTCGQSASGSGCALLLAVIAALVFGAILGFAAGIASCAHLR